MAAEEYYNHSTFPAPGSQATSLSMRNELELIESGFGKLPTLAGNGGKIVYVNVGATAMDVLPTVGTGSVVLASGATGTGNVVLATDPTFTLSDVTTNNVSTTRHGWAPKLSGNVKDAFRGDGTYTLLPAPVVVDRAADTPLAAANNGNLINFTAGFTQTLIAAATLTNGWSVTLKNASAADVTIDPNGAETIDGAATLILRPGDSRFLSCDGTNFRSIALGGASGRVPLAVIVPTNGAAAVNFLTLFTALYDDYEVIYDEIVPSGNDSLAFQYASAGAAWTNSAYGSVSNGTTATVNNNSITIGGGTGFITTTNGGGQGTLLLQNVNSSTGAKAVFISSVSVAGVNGLVGFSQQAICTSAVVMSGFRLFWSGGATFTARGVIRVFGIRKNL